MTRQPQRKAAMVRRDPHPGTRGAENPKLLGYPR